MALKSVLVTGGTGFVGSAIARALIEKHPTCMVTILDAKPPGAIHALPSSASFVQADVTVSGDVRKAVAVVRPQVVIHTAGMVGSLSERYGRKEESLIWTINVTGTKNVIDAAKDTGVEALVYTSSCTSVIDDLSKSFPNIDERWPTSHSSLVYGESKVQLSRMPMLGTSGSC
jgi:sterol-4alpha-carboxylate 3-dehydrogenase (decarboxylating)